jgi:chemotaxis protein histidine kinase CheA
MTDGRFAEMMKKLQQEYLASMPARLVRIHEQIRIRDIEALRGEFHKLKGTGRTYGFDAVSEVAEIAENRLAEAHVSCLTAASLAAAVLEELHDHYLRQRPVALDALAKFAELKRLA